MKKFTLKQLKKTGMALVIVLGTLVLLSLLAVAFLISVNKELSASKTYASGVSARGYADAVANIVVGQLRASTTYDDPTQVWVSQPGLIRIFNNQGKQVKVFKLYSSDKLVESGAFMPQAADGTPADVVKWNLGDATTNLPWNKSPGLYTDLNSPIVVNKVPSYPIINPGGLNAATRIQGFDVNTNYTLTDSTDWNGNGDTAEIAQIPMPVRWLYILADGRLATAQEDPASPKSVILTATDGAPITQASKPVARVAYWTDDDSCRLNVNTASEGGFWTMPIASAADRDLESGQVTPQEYQRYPGHPSTTSLSPALSFLTTNTSDLNNFIFSLTPRVAGRGSQSGTRSIGLGLPVAPDNDRLYASIDDILFLPSLDSSGNRNLMASTNIETTKSSELDYQFNGASSLAGTPYRFASAFSLDARRLELLRFFLTTDSRAPEVNLFGKPRISLWPIDTRNGYISTYDRLLAFCSTINSAKYYFQRQNPNSQTDDLRLIQRNTQLLSYLDQLTSTAIPGLGGSFTDKYSASDRRQQQIEIFDWIRTVNLAYRDPAKQVLPYAWTENPDASGSASPPGLPGSGQVLPIKSDDGVQGFGRFPVVAKGALAIIREKEEYNQPATNQTTISYRVCFPMETYVPALGYAGYIPNYQISVSGLSGGFAAIAKYSNNPVQTNILHMGDGTISVNTASYVEPYNGRAWGGSQGYNNLFLYNDPADRYTLKGRTLNSTDPLSGYPFASQPDDFKVVVPSTNRTELDKVKVGLQPIGNGAITIQVKAPGSAASISSETLSFPAFGPLTGAFLSSTNVVSGTMAQMSPDLQVRINLMAEAFKTNTTGAGQINYLLSRSALHGRDVIRDVELDHGDLRLLAMQNSTAAALNSFSPHRDYASTNYPQAHSLLRAAGSADPGQGYLNTLGTNKPDFEITYRGSLVKGTASTFHDDGTAGNWTPQAPLTRGTWNFIVGVPTNTPGDFTTGIGSESDGPHIIKADEGNSSFGGGNWGQSKPIPYGNQYFPYDDKLSTAFSPNRQVASAVQLGTLPSTATTPWRTFLFRPDWSTNHPGSAAPADSALLDLFWMPIVDPYPISEPLSTAGKVNMNCQIAPFTYIKRTTALLGALKAVKIPAISTNWVNYYKASDYNPGSKGKLYVSFMYRVDAAQTLLFFDERFSSNSPDNSIFKSATEICSVPLAPMQNTNSAITTGHSSNMPTVGIVGSTDIAGATNAAILRSEISKFWNLNTLTGDNALEVPYSTLYPRLTTQSDTYTLYVRVQMLQTGGKDDPTHFSDARDHVTGEYRGSYNIDRYIDYSNPSIPDFATATTKTIYPYYQFRINAAKQFLP